MGNFEDFVRYGFPGYLFICSMIALGFGADLLPVDRAFYKDFSGVAGALLIVFGPMVGFLIHQVYFVYFDWRESYVKPTRGAIGTIANLYRCHLSSAKSRVERLEREPFVTAVSFLAWKFLTTNFEADFCLNDLFIKRLRSLRNFSHSFGSIILSSLLSLLALVTLTITIGMGYYLCCWYSLFHCLLLLLFIHKRRELNERIDEMEIGIVIAERDRFESYCEKFFKTISGCQGILPGDHKWRMKSSG